VRALCLAAAALAAALVPAVAHADADPPSDFLLTQNLYLPFFGGQPSKDSADYLANVVKAGNADAYQIKVAVIGSRGDLGGVFSLFGHPKTYAPFLGRELGITSIYRGRLLVSMPQGFGYYQYHRDTARERRLIAAVPIKPGVDGLVDSTAEAVKRLAAADGHPISVQKSGGGGGSGIGTRLIIAVAGAVILAVVILLPLLLRRRRRAPA
jgi:hypothetical protein